MENRSKTLSGHRESFLDSLRASILWKGIDRAVGLLKHIVVAGTIGLSAQLDVFYLAIGLLGALVFSWGQLLDVLAVPKLVELHRNGNLQKFNQLTGGLFLWCLGWGSILCLGVLLGRDALSYIPAGLELQRRELLAESFLCLLPVIVLYIPLRFLGAVFRALRRFSLFYQGEAIISLIAFGLVLFFWEDPRVLFWSFSIGLSLAFSYLLWCSYGNFSLRGDILSAEVISVLKIAPGLLVLQGAGYLYQLTDSLFVSFLPVGAVGALAYGWTLAALVPILLSPGGAFITIFSEKRSAGETGAEVFNDLVSLSLLVGISVATFFFISGDRIIALLLQRGLFRASETQLTYQALTGYAVGMVPALLIPACNQIFQVINRIDLQRNRVLLGMACNAILNAVFLFVLGWGVGGVALATSLSYLIMLLMSLHVISRQRIEIYWRRHLYWVTTIALTCMGSAYLSRFFFSGEETSLLVIPQGAIFFTLVSLSALLMPLPENKLVRQYLRRMIPGRAG